MIMCTALLHKLIIVVSFFTDNGFDIISNAFPALDYIIAGAVVWFGLVGFFL